MEESVDPRVKKTRRFLREALLQLISEKGFDAITVKDLTQYAEINRATFYQHYYDKFDLLDQNIEDMLLNLVVTVGPKNRDELIGYGEEPSLVYVRLFEFISGNAAFFQIMLGKNGIPSFQTRMLKMIQNFVSETLEEIQPHHEKMLVPKDIFIHYVTYANFGLITYWLENDMHYSAKYMAKQMSNLAFAGAFNAIGLE